MANKINLHGVVGGGYREFWNSKARYVAVKGSRASKKSTTASLWVIYETMRYFHQYNIIPHTLVVRKLFNTHAKSTVQQLKWATHQLGVSHLWKWTTNPLKGTYLPSGSTILFAG